jgi:protoporphyrinogen oxidase
MDKDIIILGAGISGLSLAWKLGIQGIQVDVLESNSFVGGLAGTVREDGYCLDFGPHSFFSEDEKIVDTVLSLFDKGLGPRPREVKFYYNGKYLDYPLTSVNVLFQMGITSGLRSGLSFLKGKIISRKHNPSEKEEETVEDWAIANFGEHLYQTFFKPYTEQFWKVSCRELSSHSIPTHTRMSFANTCRLLLHRRFTKDGSSLIEREMLPTYYPKTGFGEIAERIAKEITKNGGNIHLDCQVTEISELSNKVCVYYKQNGQQKEIEGSYVVSTIPLHLLVKMLNPSPGPEVLLSAEKLDYRALIVLGMITEKQDILDCNYIYVLNRPYNRITEMNKFSPYTSPPTDNIIAVEIPTLKEGAAWTASKEELFDMCIGSLSEDGFLEPGDVKKLFLVKTPYAYPVYRKDYKVHLDRLLSCIQQQERLATLGRTGEFIYMDADVCMKRAFDFADDLKKNL